jgi:GTP-binding protein LepA
MNGTIRKGEKVKFFNTGVVYDADEIGVLKMDLLPKPQLARATWATSSAASRPPAR